MITGSFFLDAFLSGVIIIAVISFCALVVGDASDKWTGRK